MLLTFLLVKVPALAEEPQCNQPLRDQRPTFCQGSYALCIKAPCKPVEGNAGMVSCSCIVQSGWSMGPRALRTEGTFHNPNDFGVNKGLASFAYLQQVGRHINRRLLEVERVSQNCGLSADSILLGRRLFQFMQLVFNPDYSEFPRGSRDTEQEIALIPKVNR